MIRNEVKDNFQSKLLCFRKKILQILIRSEHRVHFVKVLNVITAI